jgi:hypothetical protein
MTQNQGSIASPTTSTDFVRAWSWFQVQSLERLRKFSPDDLEVIVWTRCPFF